MRCTSLTVLVLVACAQNSNSGSAGAPLTQAVTLVPSTAAAKPVDLPGLLNVVTYTPTAISGSVPEDEGFATLAKMGIKTVISVDGAKPDVEAAKAHGLRYVHLPISYDTVSRDRQLQLAQAMASLPGPFYVHCHHGKHRSAGALAAASVVCGDLSPEEAVRRMKVSGTSAEYTGLYGSVMSALRIEPSRLKVDPSTLPEVAQVSGIVEVMAEIDEVFDHLKVSQKANWSAPAHHPDLVPAKEASRLVNLFAVLQHDQGLAREHGAEFTTMLDREHSQAKALLAAIEANSSDREARLELIGKGCKECHKSYRDK